MNIMSDPCFSAVAKTQGLPVIPLNQTTSLMMDDNFSKCLFRSPMAHTTMGLHKNMDAKIHSIFSRKQEIKRNNNKIF